LLFDETFPKLLEFRLNANDSVCTEFVITHFDK